MANSTVKRTAGKTAPTSGRTRLGFALTAEAQRLLKGLRDKHGVTQNGLIELAIREKAERDGVK
jgi:hypothetical protein